MKAAVTKTRKGSSVTFLAPDFDMFVMTRKELSDLFAEIVMSSNKIFDAMPALQQIVVSTDVEKIE